MRARRLPWLFWAGAVGYVALTVLVAVHALAAVDRAVFRMCVRHHDATLIKAAGHVTAFFSPADDLGILAVGAAALAWRRRRPAVFVTAALSAAAMAVVVLGTKAALRRPLPITPPGGHADAFPSGHTATFLVCLGTLLLLATTRRRAMRPALLAGVAAGTLVVAASLVYAGFHWLTDTLGSMALGVALLSLVSRGMESRRSRAGTRSNARTAHRR